MKLLFVRYYATFVEDYFFYEHGGHEHVYVSPNVIKLLNT